MMVESCLLKSRQLDRQRVANNISVSRAVVGLAGAWKVIRKMRYSYSLPPAQTISRRNLHAGGFVIAREGERKSASKREKGYSQASQGKSCEESGHLPRTAGTQTRARHGPGRCLCLSRRRERERERERARERERERESVAILAQVSHLCLGACDASLHRGGGAGLPRGCALEGAPVAFPGGA